MDLQFSLNQRKRILIIIFIIAFLARFLVTVYLSDPSRRHRIYSGDSLSYNGLAISLIEGNGYRDPGSGKLTSVRPPLYPLFLAGVYSVFGQNIFTVSLIQLILSAWTCLLIFHIGQKVADFRVGIISAFIAVFYPELLHWTPVIMTETLFLFLLCLAILYLLKSVRQNSISTQILAGLFLGLTALCRPVILLFPLCILIWIILIPEINLKEKIRNLAIIFLFMGLTILPWSLRNYFVHHSFVPVSTDGGLVFYQGNSPEATGGTRGYVDGKDYIYPKEELEGMSEVEKDRYLYKSGLKFIRYHPKRFLKSATKKFKNMWRPTWEGSSKLNYCIMLPAYGFLIIFGVVGLIYSFRRWRNFLLVYLIIIYFILFHMIFTGMIRFRLPAIPFIIIFAAFGVEKLFRKLIIKIKS